MVIDVELKNIEPNTYLYDICNKNYLHFNQYGVCDKGSFTSCRRFFMIQVDNTKVTHRNVFNITNINYLKGALNTYNKSKRIRVIYGELFNQTLLYNKWEISIKVPGIYTRRETLNINVYIGRRDLLYPKQWSGFEEKERISVKKLNDGPGLSTNTEGYVNSFVI